MLKKALVIGALVGFGFAGSANAAVFCADVYVNVDGNEVAQNVCTPA